MHLVQGSPEWLSVRKLHITSSDAADIMGCGFDTPYKLWRYKMGLDEKVFTPQQLAMMEEGKRLEPIAREWFIKETGIQVQPEVVFKGHLMASLDGASLGGQIVEIKCGFSAHDKAFGGHIPDYYYSQIQHQLAITNATKCFYVTYWSNEGIIMEVERDEKWIEEYLPKAKAFHDCLMNYIAPPVTDSDYRVMDKGEWMIVSGNYKKVCEDIERLEIIKKKYKDHLIKISEGQSSKGAGIKLLKVARKGCIDYAAASDSIKAAGIDLEQFRGPTKETWSVYIEKEKE